MSSAQCQIDIFETRWLLYLSTMVTSLIHVPAPVRPTNLDLPDRQFPDTWNPAARFILLTIVIAVLLC